MLVIIHAENESPQPFESPYSGPCLRQDEEAAELLLKAREFCERGLDPTDALIQVFEGANWSAISYTEYNLDF